MGRIYRIIKKYGKINCILGFISYVRNYFLWKKYHFEKWHLTPIQFRPYAQDMIKTINKLLRDYKINGPIVEVGCGLGEILGSIKGVSNKRIGLDLSCQVINAAQNIWKNIDFREGSFDDLKEGEVGILIFVNFIHTISTEELKKLINDCLRNNKAMIVVLDVVHNSESSTYKYTHDTKQLFEGLPYTFIKKSSEYQVMGGAQRHIEYWGHKALR